MTNFKSSILNIINSTYNNLINNKNNNQQLSDIRIADDKNN